jgi:hypothetical protein
LHRVSLSFWLRTNCWYERPISVFSIASLWTLGPKQDTSISHISPTFQVGPRWLHFHRPWSLLCILLCILLRLWLYSRFRRCFSGHFVDWHLWIVRRIARFVTQIQWERYNMQLTWTWCL